MMPMNNPILQMMQMARSGGSLPAMLQQLAARDPRVGQTMQMLNGKSPQEMQRIAQNMARERNIDLNQMLQQFGFTGTSGK